RAEWQRSPHGAHVRSSTGHVDERRVDGQGLAKRDHHPMWSRELDQVDEVPHARPGEDRRGPKRVGDREDVHRIAGVAHAARAGWWSNGFTNLLAPSRLTGPAGLTRFTALGPRGSSGIGAAQVPYAPSCGSHVAPNASV